MAKELEEGPSAERTWYDPKPKKKKDGAEAAKPKISKIKQKRLAAKEDAPTSNKDADFYAREAKRKRKLKKLRTVIDDDVSYGKKGHKLSNTTRARKSKGFRSSPTLAFVLK